MRITVVVPTFNSMKYVDQCLDSVLAQTYDDMEVIVYDNESSDGTYEHLKSRRDEGEEFKLISIPNVEPNGYREAMDHVFDNCKSDYVTFISSDDYVDKDYIKRYMKVIDESPVDVKCIQSGLIWINDQRQIINQKYHTYESLEDFKKLCMTYCPVNNPTVLYHKSIWPLLNKSREAHFENNLQDIGVGDYDMWCGLADKDIPIVSITGYLGYFYRWHSEQATWKVQKDPTNYDKIIQDYWRKKWKM
tara:strand:- start:10394 stop:11134 length:741 start_codon:yes stop_codon:yes gene_type:complete